MLPLSRCRSAPTEEEEILSQAHEGHNVLFLSVCAALGSVSSLNHRNERTKTRGDQGRASICQILFMALTAMRRSDGMRRSRLHYTASIASSGQRLSQLRRARLLQLGRRHRRHSLRCTLPCYQLLLRLLQMGRRHRRHCHRCTLPCTLPCTLQRRHSQRCTLPCPSRCYLAPRLIQLGRRVRRTTSRRLFAKR